MSANERMRLLIAEDEKNLGIVLRLTYHNISASPRRQFFNADAGFVGRF